MIYLLVFLFVSVRLTRCTRDNCYSLLDMRLHGSKYAGRLEVCWWYLWLPVCGNNWSNISAGVACRQLNFTNPLYQEHLACGYNCFGNYDSSNRTLEINCLNHDLSHVKDCAMHDVDSFNCHAYAGIFCDVAPIITKSNVSTPPTPTPSFPPVMDNCGTLRRALGGATTVLILILVGVLIGWVWSYHKRSSKHHRFFVQPNDNEVANPTYDADRSNNISSVEMRINRRSREIQVRNYNNGSNEINQQEQKTLSDVALYDSLIGKAKYSDSRPRPTEENETEYYSICKDDTKVQGYEIPVKTEYQDSMKRQNVILT